MSVIPFGPIAAGTVNVTGAASSARVSLGAASKFQVRLYNSGSVTAFIEFGDSTVAAAVATGFPLPAGQVEVFTIPQSTTHMAAITSTGTAVVYASLGMGV